jgi:hypothetical protein
MKEKQIYCIEALSAYLVIELHLIIFGPGRGEADPMRAFRKNLNNPKFSGIDILSVKNMPTTAAEKCFEVIVEVVGWPDGSRVKVNIEKTNHDNLSPFIWVPRLITINIPNLFDEQLFSWMPVPPFFKAVSDGDQSQPELLTKLIKSVELSGYL